MIRRGMDKVDALHRELVRTGAVSALDFGGTDERTWRDCDLASLAENRLGDRTDPRELDDPRRQDWEKRAASDELWPPSRREYERCYWLLDKGERVGTVALATSTLGGKLVRLSSFYVFPTHRHLGVGTRALGRIREGLTATDLGLRLETSWSWQRTVRWYLRAGLWVRMWKRDLEFCWRPGDPAPMIDVGEQQARLTVVGSDPMQSAVLLAHAVRSGDRLSEFSVRDESTLEGVDKAIKNVSWEADSTLALGLALAGWPLVRSNADWDKKYWADAGPPEALAYKITTWEAWDRHHGWRVETPRIVGLAYPTWEEFEARWEAERSKFEHSQ